MKNLTLDLREQLFLWHGRKEEAGENAEARESDRRHMATG